MNREECLIISKQWRRGGHDDRCHWSSRSAAMFNEAEKTTLAYGCRLLIQGWTSWALGLISALRAWVEGLIFALRLP